MKICPHCQTKFEDPKMRFCGRDGKPLVEAAESATQSQAPPLSGSLAMALFPSYSIDKTMEPNRGVNPLCQPDVEINTVHLYYELPIISLWYLREHNFIRFVQSTSPDRHSAVGIEAVPANQTSVPGLEFDYWEIIKTCAPGTPIHEVVRPLFGSEDYYPERNLRQRIAEWLVQLGYGQSDNKPKPFLRVRRLGVASEVVGDDGDRRLFEFLPDCQRIMAQQQTAQMILERWSRFLADEPDLYQWLFAGVVRAGNDASSGGMHRRYSIYCSAAEKHHQARSRRSNAQAPSR
jgi:hypothetical protein